MSYLSILIGIIMLIYGIIVLLLLGMGHLFNFFYFLSGTALILISIFYQKIRQILGHRLFDTLAVIGIAFVLSFVLIEIRIITFSFHKGEADADYVVILGSQLKENGPSIDFQGRIDLAYEYLRKNPDTMVICTGAQGPDEPDSEANGAALCLLNKGLDMERIILEDRSYSTYQNLQNARSLIAKEKDPGKAQVVVISSLYHLYRAAYLCRKLGYGPVSFQGSHGLLILLPHYYAREYFALIKEVLFTGSG